MGSMVFPGELAALLPEVQKVIPPEELKMCVTVAHIEIKSHALENSYYDGRKLDIDSEAIKDQIVANALRLYPNRNRKADKSVLNNLKDLHETIFSGYYDSKSVIAGAGMEILRERNCHSKDPDLNYPENLCDSEVVAAIFEVKANNQSKIFEGKKTDETPSVADVQKAKDKMLKNPDYRKAIVVQHAPVAQGKVSERSYIAGIGKQRALNNKRKELTKNRQATYDKQR